MLKYDAHRIARALVLLHLTPFLWQQGWAATNGNVLSASGTHSLQLRPDGRVIAWGWLLDFSLRPWMPALASGLTGVVAVAAASNHALAVKSDGTLWAWGPNSLGVLGVGISGGPGNIVMNPLQVSQLTDVVAAGGGYNSSLALKRDGTVWAWGFNSYGALGDGTTKDRFEPVK